jgi:hypothetical protein
VTNREIAIARDDAPISQQNFAVMLARPLRRPRHSAVQTALP